MSVDVQLNEHLLNKLLNNDVDDLKKKFKHFKKTTSPGMGFMLNKGPNLKLLNVDKQEIGVSSVGNNIEEFIFLFLGLIHNYLLFDIMLVLSLLILLYF